MGLADPLLLPRCALGLGLVANDSSCPQPSGVCGRVARSPFVGWHMGRSTVLTAMARSTHAFGLLHPGSSKKRKIHALSSFLPRK